MTRSRRRGPLISKKHFPELREWMNAATGIAALLLAVVSFWTTARISGLEDYLRSEISRRNSDLDTLAKRSGEVESLAAERERQLARLDAATNDIIAASLLAQSQLSKSQSDLAGVRSDVAAARSQASDALNARDRFRADLASQARDFELFQRQQAYQLASIQLSRMASYELMKDKFEMIPSGTGTIAMVERLTAPQGQPEIERFYQVIRTGTSRACPSFDRIAVNLPAKPVKPGEPPSPVRVFSREDPAYVQYQKAYAEWSKADQLFFNQERAYSEARITEQFRLVSEARQCMCKAPTDEQYSAAKVCVAAET